LADCPCFPARRKAYRLHPPSTSPGLEFDFAQVDGGTLLRGIQAVLQELAGSATGGRGLGAGLVRLEGALRAWLPIRRPAARNAHAKIAMYPPGESWGFFSCAC